MHTFIAEEDIYEDAEEDDYQYYDVGAGTGAGAGAGDAPYILPGNILNLI